MEGIVSRLGSEEVGALLADPKLGPLVRAYQRRRRDAAVSSAAAGSTAES